jgi:hypothetical protein
MKTDQLEKILNDSDFTIDELGRVNIENPEVLSIINGAGQGSADFDNYWNMNAGCVNGGC